jgi:initiation factor 1A
MVKNLNGGNKAKGQARKFTTGKQSFVLRIAIDELEIYAQVTKLLGNGMCHVLGIDGKKRLCHIRGKFRGRGKRDNLLVSGSLILIGLREWEDDKSSGTSSSGKLPQCDLLEVYTDSDREHLKMRVHDVDWRIFASEETKEDATADILFEDEGTSEYKDIIDKAVSSSSKMTTIVFDDEEINVDDI